MKNVDSLPAFLRFYVEAAGRYVVPPIFHYWCAISLLGTFASRHLALEHIPGNPLRPNLYTILIGRSAAGKGLAITTAMNLVKPDLVHTNESYSSAWPYLYEGRTSPQGLTSRLNWLGKNFNAEEIEFLLIAPELAQAFDLPTDLVSRFVYMLTGLYDSTGREWFDNTRMHGFLRVPPSYPNWLAGTTLDWFRLAINADDFRGGFSGRIIPVYVEDRPDFAYKPIASPRRDELIRYLKTHLTAIRTLRGTFTMDTDARDIDEAFAQDRYVSTPHDDRILPFYERGATLARKLSMSFSLARGFDLRIKSEDMAHAQRAVLQIEADLPKIMDAVSETKETRALEIMRKTIEDAGTIPRRAVFGLLRRQAGITRTPMLEYEATLQHEGSIVIDYKTDSYVWSRTRLIIAAAENAPHEEPDETE